MSDDAREQEIQYMMGEVRVHCSIFFNTYFFDRISHRRERVRLDPVSSIGFSIAMLR